jgi:outer membrane lipoprotein SlyB
MMAKTKYGQISHRDINALNKESLREDIATAGKIGVTALGAVTGAVVGGIPGAIVGGTIGYAGLGRYIGEAQKLGKEVREKRRANQQRRNLKNKLKNKKEK